MKKLTIQLSVILSLFLSVFAYANTDVDKSTQEVSEYANLINTDVDYLKSKRIDTIRFLASLYKDKTENRYTYRAIYNIFDEKKLWQKKFKDINSKIMKQSKEKFYAYEISRVVEILLAKEITYNYKKAINDGYNINFKNNHIDYAYADKFNSLEYDYYFLIAIYNNWFYKNEQTGLIVDRNLDPFNSDDFKLISSYIGEPIKSKNIHYVLSELAPSFYANSHLYSKNSLEYGYSSKKISPTVVKYYDTQSASLISAYLGLEFEKAYLQNKKLSQVYVDSSKMRQSAYNLAISGAQR